MAFGRWLPAMAAMTAWLAQPGAAAEGSVAPAATDASTPAPAASEPDPHSFQWCDGFGSPSGQGDGMTRDATPWLTLFGGGTAGDTTMAKTSFSALGANNRTAALSSSRLRPEYHLRRASLLRARAIHKLAGKDNAGALADLDAADAEGRLANEPLFERSMGVGNKLMRAYALIHAGKRTEAVALSREVQKQRPYAYSVRMAAGLVALAASNDGEEFFNQLVAIAPAHPAARAPLFDLAMDLGQFDQAIATRRLIDLTPPPERADGFTLQDYPGLLFKLFAQGFTLDGKLAFALAAQGKAAEATTLLNRMTGDVEAAAMELPDRPDGSKPPRLDREVQLRKRLAAPLLRKILQQDKAAVALLPMAQAGDEERFLAAIKAQTVPLPPDGRMLFLLKTLRAHVPLGEHRELDGAIGQVRALLSKSLAVGELPLNQLYEAMPGAEIPARLPKYRSAKNFLGENTGNGFTIASDGAVTTISFGGTAATSAIVGEMAMLKAADLALAAGKVRLAVLTERITTRTIRNVGLYSGGGTTNEGFVAVLRFVPFGAEGPPPGFGDYAAAWVGAEDVRSALLPVYSLAPGAGEVPSTKP